MSDQKADRLRLLLSMEIRRVTEDLERRRQLLVQVWGRQRVRVPFVETTFNRWTTLGFDDLTLLTTPEITSLDAFYRELDEVRLYLSYTEDMPRNLDLALMSSIARMKKLAEAALGAMGRDPLEGVIPLEWIEEKAPQAGEEVEMSLSLDWNEE